MRLARPRWIHGSKFRLSPAPNPLSGIPRRCRPVLVRGFTCRGRRERIPHLAPHEYAYDEGRLIDACGRGRWGL